MDIALLLATAPLTVPLGLAVAAALLIGQGRPLFYRQERTGMGGQTFYLIKYRTMGPERSSDGRVLFDFERVGRLGGLVRRLSLDELPQLINVATGTMSFVGPRPLPVRYTPYMRGRELLRFEVRPGVTGLSQVSGRNSLTWDDRLELDVQYVERMSFAMDVQLLLRTLSTVLSAKGYTDKAQLRMDDLDVERRRRTSERGEQDRG